MFWRIALCISSQSCLFLLGSFGVQCLLPEVRMSSVAFAFSTHEDKGFSKSFGTYGREAVLCNFLWPSWPVWKTFSFSFSCSEALVYAPKFASVAVEPSPFALVQCQYACADASALSNPVRSDTSISSCPLSEEESACPGIVFHVGAVCLPVGATSGGMIVL